MSGQNGFGQFIRLCRQSLGYSLRKVAQLSEEDPAFERITPGNLAMIEQGRHIPSFAKVVTLSRIYNAPMKLFEENYWSSTEEEPSCSPDESPALLLDEGWMQYGAGRLAEAHHKFKRALAARPESAESRTLKGEARLAIALCKFRKRHYYGAREELESLLGDPVASTGLRARAWLILSRIQKISRNPTMAGLHAREALRWARDESGSGLKARILYVLAEANQDLGDMGKAGKGYRRILLLTSRDSTLKVAAMRRLAHCLAEQGEPAEAEDLLAQAMEAAAALGFGSEAVRNQLDMATLLLTRRRLREAKALARSGLLTARDLNERELEYRALFLLRYVAGHEGDWLREKEYRRTLVLLERKYGKGGRWAPSTYCPLDADVLRLTGHFHSPLNERKKTV